MLKPLHGHFFVVQNPHSGPLDGVNIMFLAGKLLVVACGKVDAEWRREFLEWSGQFVEIGLGSVEKIAGDEDDVRSQPSGERHQAPAESRSIDVAQMQVAQQHRPASAPALRQALAA